MQQAHSRRVIGRVVAAIAYGINVQQSSGWFFLKYETNHAKKLLIAVACIQSWFFPLGSLCASPLVNVTFSGDNGQFASYYGQIANDLNNAAAEWEKLFVSNNTSTLNLNVVFDNSPTANSSSSFVTPLYNIGSTWVYQQGAVDAVLYGVHSYWGPYDAVLHIGTSYLTNDLWFDPNPTNIDPVPINKTDAESVFLHEFGHIFGFEGYRDPSTGALWFDAESTFDTLISFVNNSPYFTGSDAESIYGGPVPLTVGNIYHVGNPSGPGADLEIYPGDLMNGNVFYTGTRYSISALDAAMFADLGLATNFTDVTLATNLADVPPASEIPEPRMIGIFGTALIALWLSRRWWRISGPGSAPSIAAQ
jgi:hypothetical protein